MPRKEPKPATVKRLFALSGNTCAFPDCNEQMVDGSGIIIGEICHIEAAEMGGPRFNNSSNDEKRRHFENLILLCSNHHKKVDSDPSYTCESLKVMKAEHEKIIASNQYDVPDNVVAQAMIAYRNEINPFNISGAIGTQINIRTETLNYRKYFNEAEELTVVDEIFAYVLNRIGAGVDDEPESKENVKLQDKITLNFKLGEEQEEVDTYLKAALLKRDLIEQKFQTLESERQKDLHTHIFGLYNEFKRTGKRNIEILTELFNYFTPEKKAGSSTHVNLAKALVLFFFEDCTIFEKTKAEKDRQKYKQKSFDF